MARHGSRKGKGKKKPSESGPILDDRNLGKKKGGKRKKKKNRPGGKKGRSVHLGESNFVVNDPKLPVRSKKKKKEEGGRIRKTIQSEKEYRHE